ncbi:MAG TPA: hypothetical protein VK152_02560, partial [Paludibacter sp.]|nr:hypothetical protein [Paludibacter sp.]
MKGKNLALIISLCAGMACPAQTRLTAERNTCRAADQIVKQQVEFKDPGPSGKDLHWDFSMVQPVNEDYTLDYFIPDSTQMTKLCGREH